MKGLAKIIMTSIFLVSSQNILNGVNTEENISKKSNNKINKNIIENITTKIYSSYDSIENIEYRNSVGIEFEKFFRLVYSDRDDSTNATGTEILKSKTLEELNQGLILKSELEKTYDSILKNVNLNYMERKLYDYESDKWGRLINGEQKIPKGTYRKNNHEALDIFTREGNTVIAPFTGLVIASGDKWQGSFYRRRISKWNGKGLTPRAGNSIIIYNPVEKGYLLLAHFKENISVRAGDIVCKGQTLGYVGHSGSASIRGHGEHLHAAYKIRDSEGYLAGIDFSKKIKK